MNASSPHQFSCTECQTSLTVPTLEPGKSIEGPCPNCGAHQKFTMPLRSPFQTAQVPPNPFRPQSQATAQPPQQRQHSSQTRPPFPAREREQERKQDEEEQDNPVAAALRRNQESNASSSWKSTRGKKTWSRRAVDIAAVLTILALAGALAFEGWDKFEPNLAGLFASSQNTAEAPEVVAPPASESASPHADAGHDIPDSTPNAPPGVVIR